MLGMQFWFTFSQSGGQKLSLLKEKHVSTRLCFLDMAEKRGQNDKFALSTPLQLLTAQLAVSSRDGSTDAQSSH